MIKKRYIFILLFVLVTGAVVVDAIGYALLSRHAGETEIVFAPTKVGTPVGDKVTKDIGPEGGALTSADGKLTITVPKGTVAGNTQFSVQPITSGSDAGVGGAYRLEPSDAHFATPVQLTRHYDDDDLDGTVAAALQLAFQDKDGSWHVQTASKVDETAKMLTVSTTHFSDWLVLRTIGVSPAKATVPVGETVYIKVDSCPDRDPIQKYNIWKYVFGHDCHKISADNSAWKLTGAGKLTATDNVAGIVYTAPPVRPADPLARVSVDIDVPIRDPDTGEVRTYPRKFECRIKIVGGGYRASGKGGTTVISGEICDLGKAFSLKTNNPFVPTLEFEPDAASTTNGTFIFTTGNGLSGSCECTYTITGIDTPAPKIELKGSSTGSLGGITESGGGSMHLDLVPLDKECKP